MSSLASHLQFAQRIALLSKDNSTKVGAVFFDAHNSTPLVWGYNGMPRGLNDQDPVKTQRPEKYFWFEHAERNAIYNAAQSLLIEQAPIAFCSHTPSMEGARALVSSGVQKVYFLTPHIDPRVEELFHLTKVEFGQITGKEMNKTLQKYFHFLQLAQHLGETDSHPEAAQRGGVLILNGRTLSPLCSGATRPPTSLHFKEQDLPQDEGHWWIQEPEKDAMFNLVRPTLKGSHAFVSWCPCIRCALAMASVGVERMVTHELNFNKENDLRWKPDFLKTQSLLKVLNIEFITLPEAPLMTLLDLTQATAPAKLKR